MELFSVLITGANRGLGLEFVRQILRFPNPPSHVFATYRNIDATKELDELRNTAPSAVQVHLVKFDVRDSADLDNLKRTVEDTVGDRGLTLLINNAGMAQKGPFPNVTRENMNIHFQVNTIGPILVAQAFLPLLKKAAADHPNPGMSFSRAGILNISSFVASLTRTGVEFVYDLGVPAYKMSKTALNMGMRVMAVTVKEDNILIVNIDPGWVKTDMGGNDHAEITPEQSIGEILNTMSKLNESHHGTYLDRFGNTFPW